MTQVVKNNELTCSTDAVFQMWSSVRVAALVVVALVAVTEATYSKKPPSYPRPAPCYPQVKYVTHYQTQVQEVSRRSSSLVTEWSYSLATE